MCCQDFPSELKAAALEEFAPVNRRTLLETCITNLKKAYQVFLENPESALQDWKSHSNNLGREIQILEPNGEIWTGIATDLDSSGGLVVCANGQTRILFAAEIS